MKLKSIGIVVTLVLTMFMAAIESSIISLALPTIRKDLNAGTAVPLVFTVYFIALVVANPIVGELLTRFKILYIAVVGILLFGIGSFMSGMSETFIMLIISRALQGLGAGVMMSLTQIVPKLAFEIPLRYKNNGHRWKCPGNFKYSWTIIRWWNIRSCNMALVILYQHTNCIDSHCFSFSYFSFSKKRKYNIYTLM